MALSNTERQAIYRDRRKRGELRRIDVTLPLEDARRLDNLTAHWGCTKTEAVKRMLWETWRREGEPLGR